MIYIYIYFYDEKAYGQYGRGVKALDSKSNGQCPRGFESHYCRMLLLLLLLYIYDMIIIYYIPR